MSGTSGPADGNGLSESTGKRWSVLVGFSFAYVTLNMHLRCIGWEKINPDLGGEAPHEEL